MLRVPISEGEAVQIWKWARERQAAKSPNARSRRFSYGKDDLSIHYDGIKGEYAIAKALLLPFENNPLPGGDKGAPDLILPNGWSAQIKFREKPEWDFALRGTDPEEFNTDIGILVSNADPHLLNDDVLVVGWITAEEFREKAKVFNYTKRKGGERLAVSPPQMRPAQELIYAVYAQLVLAA